MDGTNFLVPQHRRKFYSYKFRTSAIQYEIALSILSREICLISSPWNTGGWNILKIFRASLTTQLDPFEQVEAGDGYIGEAPLKVKKEMMKRVQSHQETINKQ